MPKLPSLSIAAKLYTIFALLATATAALAGIAVVNARHHAAMTSDYETSLSGTQNVERVDGLVYAVDINPEAIQHIDARLKKEDLHNVKTILGKPNNPLLPASVDAVLLLKTYHEVAQPIVLFRNLRHSLAKDAKVGVIDRNGDGANHGVGRDVVIREMKAAGYTVIQQEDYKKDGMDYFLVFASE